MLWLSPWTRPAVRVQSEALIRHGADVLLVTSDRHPESDAARDYELVLEPRFLTASTWPPTLQAFRRVRQFRPDVVIAEQVRDPRWMALAGRKPRIQVIHDDAPHDPAEALPSFELAVLDRWGARSAATIAYCDYVANAVAARRDVAGTPVHVVPLASDLDLNRVPPFVAAEGRHDFVMFGRLNPYKNAEVVLEAWRRHIAGGGWRGDNLILIGDGTLDPASLPEHTQWRRGGYRYSDVVATLAAAKGSIAHYRRATQSGVQVLSMHLGVMPIISTEGGPPQYQPPDCPPIGVDDVAGLAAAFDMLADPAAAASQGATASRHYELHCAVDLVAERFLDVIAEVLARRR
ncbi:glycosyltransferase [Mycobacterium shigaense]|uniref:glycosyltransferase n=1 Tax=Mycobacterium shigaense TaxID=722731 RepID=UPI002ADF01E1|nr:glycosyltransferase [Mycobacterium shigaense]MEA1120764.1 glycosyltransferase [Mycobacterium shigaense]